MKPENTIDDKPKRKRRSKDVIAQEKKTWIARHEWSGPKRALELIRKASAELEEAQAACNGSGGCQPLDWKGVQQMLGNMDSAISAAIPPEAT